MNDGGNWLQHALRWYWLTPWQVVGIDLLIFGAAGFGCYLILRRSDRGD